ncbi:MAG TPA: hypothetical protein VJT72_07785 [Pseudonocardiaceae bacterium]|nr:hypothetical protein [Pseudonocardiaceae bacterium]
MGIQIVGPSGTVSEVGVGASAPQHATLKPIPYGALGHYRSAVRFSLANTQAANSRLWEVRNTHATNLIIPTRLEVRWTQTGNHTASIRDSLQLFRLTSFSAVDTTNTVTPTVSPRRASMAAAPGGVAIRHVTVAGAAAGMTGGTLTKDGGASAIMEQWLIQTTSATIQLVPVVKEMLDDVNGTHPFALVQNEGLMIENEVLLGAAAASSVVVDFSWAEVSAY